MIRPSYYAVPDSAHPMVRMLFSEMLRRGMSLGEMAAAQAISCTCDPKWNDNKPCEMRHDVCNRTRRDKIRALPLPKMEGK